MKRILLSLLKNLALFFQDIYDRYAADHSPENHPYQSLSPINNATGVDQYINALRWALKNRKSKDIKNIALTGPYGSGKSSILRTFQQNNKAKELHFLPISLATFKEEMPRENGKGNGEELLRLIELSILQQIFYHEEDSKIPDSRFKKIKSFKKINIWLATIGIMTMLMAILYLFQPDKFLSITGIEIDSGQTKKWLRYISLILVFASLFIVILRSFRTLYSVGVNKLKIQSAEIEIGKNVNKSILNNHLDEILYFFEVTKYNVVIIEDLDRFEQTEIFTKLREINLLINNSEKIKREVVFVYAVRDEMFQDKDRTKFFDFIIPVIPIINASNSNEILKKLIFQYQYKISEELIEDVSLFIDDMRLLHNICNEYHIYHKNLDPHLNQTKLLAMVVYKNIHPKDFVLLGHGQGDLYNIFAEKSVSVKKQMDKLDNDINANISKLTQREVLRIRDKKELRTLYINAYIPHLEKFHSFRINGQDHNFDSVIKDDNFDYFLRDKMEYAYYNDTGLGYSKVAVRFTDIENKIDPNTSYKEREQRIDDWNNESTDLLKIQIKELENKKSETRHLKIWEIVARGDIKIITPHPKQTHLLNILLRNGYIAEDYLDYISIFYPESITKEDRQFLLNVKGLVRTDFDFKLNRIDKLLTKLSERDFLQSAVLNFNLLDFLLVHPAHAGFLNNILSQLSDQSDSSLEFIFGFIDKGVNINLFIHELCKRWHAIWHYIASAAAFSDDDKHAYFNLIFVNAEIQDIAAIAERSDLKTYIETKKGLLSATGDTEKVRSLISTLKPKFHELYADNITPELADFIYQGNFYRLSPQMLEAVIRERGHYDKTALDTCNYHAIKKSGCVNLFGYVNSSINNYVKNVYLKIATNTKEPEDTLAELLNNNGIIIENKMKIIEHTGAIIKDIRLITNAGLAGLLLSRSRVDPAWDNLVNYYRTRNYKIDDHLVAFFNNPDNIKALTAEKTGMNNAPMNKKVTSQFLNNILGTNNIENSSYEQILSILPYTYDNFLFGKISKDKAYLLVKYRALSLTVQNYLGLKNAFPGLHITLLEDRFGEFLEKPELYLLDDNDMLTLLASSKLPLEQKKKFLYVIGRERISSNNKIRQAIVELNLNNTDLTNDNGISKQPADK